MAGDRTLRIGISRCLLGDEVRYDGGHMRDALLVSTFASFVEWVAVCPEVEAGMGTPREPIHLVASDDGAPAGARRVRLLGVTSGRDWTDRMTTFSASRARALAEMDLAGYVFKKDSPSCGLEHVRVRSDAGEDRTGRGLFAEALVRALPNLPVEEEGRLQDPVLREHFVERVFAYGRLRGLLRGQWTVGELAAFHTAHELQILAHSRAHYDELGRLVAGAAAMPCADVEARYETLFMRALSRPGSRGGHADALTHALERLKPSIDAAERTELIDAIEGVRLGMVPLVVPLTLIQHHSHRHDVVYLREQTYLNPDPRQVKMAGVGGPSPSP